MNSDPKAEPIHPDHVSSEEDDPTFFIKMAEHNLEYKADGSAAPELKDMALCLTSCKWGHGEAGSLLMEYLLATFSESMVKPKYFVLLDSGVYLATPHSPTEGLDSLLKLEQAGVEIWISESSVNEYNLRKEIQVGRVVKFLEIAQLMLSVEKFVNF